MRIRMNISSVIAALLMLTWSSAIASSDWIYGTWWYADSSGRIVEGDDKDGMIFRKGDTVDLIYGSGKVYLTCQYSIVTNAQLNVDCIARGKKQRLRFVIDPNLNKLAGVEDIDNGFYKR